MDSGATINVLPYQIGIQLGATWDDRKASIRLAGNLGNLDAMPLFVAAQVGDFAPVHLAFAWVKSNTIPLILGAESVMQKLAPEKYANVQELFRPWAYRPLAEAVIAGSSPGEIYVDNVDQPAVALMATVEQYLLTGDPTNTAAQAGLKALLSDIITSGKAFLPGAAGLFVSVYPESWTQLLDEVYTGAGRPRIIDKRRHYVCTQANIDWRSHLPEGYTIDRVEAGSLAKSGLVWAEPLSPWHEDGITFWARQGNTVVCWAPTVCSWAGRCEVGIGTAGAHQRRGLATATAAAFVEYCLSHGFASVGWDCSDYNEASWRTAQRAGFHPIRADRQHYCMFDETLHWTETGWIAFREGRYPETVEAYQKAFALKPDASADSYHEAALACDRLGDHRKANYYRRAAVERGRANC